MMPAAPMEAPMATRIMIVLRCSVVTLFDWGEAVEDAVGDSELVMVTASIPVWL